MATVVDVLVYTGFLATPLAGFLVLQVLLRTGWFTEGTEKRQVPLFSTTADYFTFKSRVHKWTVMAGFCTGWISTLLLYIYVLDVVYFSEAYSVSTNLVVLGVFTLACLLAVYQSQRENWTTNQKIGAVIFLTGVAVGLFLDEVLVPNSPIRPWVEPIGAVVMVGGAAVSWVWQPH